MIGSIMKTAGSTLPGGNVNTGPVERNNIAVIDSDPGIGLGLSDTLSLEGYDVVYLRNAEAIENGFAAPSKQMVLIDIGVGEKYISRTIAGFPELLIIVLVEEHEKEDGLNCVRDGAYDYLEKPLKIDDVLATVGRGFEKLKLEETNRANRLSNNQEGPPCENSHQSAVQTVTPSEPLNAITHEIEEIAVVLRNEIWNKPSNSPVLEPLLERLINISDQVETLGRLGEQEVPNRFNLSEAIEGNLGHLNERLKYVGVEVINTIDWDVTVKLPVRKEFDHAITYLISAAIKASDRGAPVYLGASQGTDGSLNIIIRDAGMTGYSEEIIGEYCLMNGPVFRLMKACGGYASSVSELGVGSTTKLAFPNAALTINSRKPSEQETLAA